MCIGVCVLGVLFPCNLGVCGGLISVQPRTCLGVSVGRVIPVQPRTYPGVCDGLISVKPRACLDVCCVLNVLFPCNRGHIGVCVWTCYSRGSRTSWPVC